MISEGLTRAKSNQKAIFIGKGGDARDEGYGGEWGKWKCKWKCLWKRVLSTASLYSPVVSVHRILREDRSLPSP